MGNDTAHGHGEYLYTNGDRYTGEFRNGKTNGKGKCICKNKETYEGQWKEGLKDDPGVEIWAD